MKRWSLFIISLVLIYICVGCGKTESDTENPSQQDPSQTDIRCLYAMCNARPTPATYFGY